MKREYQREQSLMQKILNLLSLENVRSASLLLTSFLPGKLYKLTHKKIWVISESAENARDNGYWFFKYMRENHQEILSFYPIRKKASDYHKVEALGNTVEFGSFKHYMLFWAADRFIGTTKYHGFPEEELCSGLTMHNLTGFKYVFLNHGFARGFSNIVNGKTSNYAMIIAMSELEKEIFIRYNNQSADRIRAVGFCRHDNLNDELLDPKTILIMPTWRRWLDFRHETDPVMIEKIRRQYLDSDYYHAYHDLLNNERFLSYIEEHDLKVIFYLHGYAQNYVQYFSSPSPNVTIAAKAEYFVQDLLKEAAFLITDYSSVAFDYAYMKKPMLYFQFDAEEFSRIQYAESELYTYEKKGFGPIVTATEQVVEEVIRSYENGFSMDDTYRERVEAFFPSFGTDHCKTTYELIRDL